jgi:hypothetical protein
MDMYLTFEGIEGQPPVLIRCLAWSHGLGSRDYGSPPQPTIPHPKTWDRKFFNSWLVENELDPLVEIFEKAEITGKELLNLGREDLKELGVKLVHRVRLEVVITAAGFLSSPTSEVSIQDLSVTSWVDDRMAKALFLHDQ